MSMVQGRKENVDVRLSNIDVHETISDNLNINIDINLANTQPFLNNTHNNKQDNEEIENLRKSIVDTLINDITAFNMHDIMRRPILESEEIITHVINVKPGSEPVKQKSRGIPHSFREEFKKQFMK
jgi:glutamyl-tRNA reductase